MMRLVLALGAVLGTVLTMTACGTPNGNANDTGASPGGGVVSTGPLPTPSGLPPAIQPNQVQPDNRAVELRPVRWDRTEGTGRQLTVHFTLTGRPGCQVLGRVDLVEAAQAVTVTLHLGRLPDVDCRGIQPLLAAPATTVVTLREPVGTRTVRDGAAG
jgi:hypothetical protein